LDNDLAIDGVRIDKVENAAYRRTLSITQERHQAFNWLLGFERLYSEVTTDTWGLLVATSTGHGSGLDSNVIVDGLFDPLLAAEISLRSLYRNMP
jgi:hypothetical protein